MTADAPDQPAASAGGSRQLPGPGAIAGALLFTTALQRADIDPQTQARLLQALGDIVPARPLPAGTAGADRTLPAASLAALLPSSAVVAAGLDPATVGRPPTPVLWTDGENQLLVRIGEVHGDLVDSAVVLTVPVSCDQTGPVDVTVTFVSGTPGSPAGGVTVTEDHPRGPPEVVETWADPLIAFAWHTLLVATSAMSAAGGNDLSGRGLIPADLGLTKDGLTVTPLAAHTFLAGRLGVPP
jgi:hypothetical protein